MIAAALAHEVSALVVTGRLLCFQWSSASMKYSRAMTSPPGEAIRRAMWR